MDRRQAVAMFGLTALAMSFAAHDVRAQPQPGAAGLIAFVREGPEAGVYTIERSGSGLTQLTTGQDYRPRWSPDGTEIVFQRFEGPGLFSSFIYVMDAEGSNLRRLTTQTGFQPDWSPDGARIVFGSGLGREQEIFVIDANGSDLTRLTRNRSRTLSPHGRRTVPRSPSPAAATATPTSTSWRPMGRINGR